MGIIYNSDLILPYNEKMAIRGGFIKPNGELLLDSSDLYKRSHEVLAQDYCEGTYGERLLLEQAHYGEWDSDHISESEIIQELKEKYDYTGLLNEVPLDLASSLTPEEKIAYNAYNKLSYNEPLNKQYKLSEFMNRYLKMDKVIPGEQIIVTTSKEPYYRLFNYLLMGYSFEWVCELIFDFQKNKFDPDSLKNKIDPNVPYWESSKARKRTPRDKDCEEELKLILSKKPPLEERRLYFR